MVGGSCYHRSLITDAMLLVLKMKEGGHTLRWPLEAERGKETDFSLEPPEENAALLTA